METDTQVLLPLENDVVSLHHSNIGNFLRVIILCTSKSEKLILILGVLSAICTGLAQPFQSYAFGEVSQVFVQITKAVNNQTIDPSDLDMAYEKFSKDMELVVLHFFGCGVAFFTFGAIQFSLLKYVGDQTTYRLRKLYISKLLEQNSLFFDTVSTGYLSTILNDNLERFREAFNEKIGFIICYCTEFLIGAILAFYTNWKLASYGSIFALGLAFSGLINSASMMGSTGKQNEHYARAGSIAFQALGSFKTVVSLNGQRQEVESYSSELKSGEKYGVRRAFFLATSRSSTHFFCNALNGVILYLGADLIFNKTMDQVVIVTLFHYMLFSAFSLAEAFPHISYLASAISSTAPISKIVTAQKNKIENTDDDLDRAKKSISIEGHIKLENVMFSYPTRPDTQVLKGISFEVNTGEKIALVGASGSGKSTIVQLLLQFYNIDSGNIFIDGESTDNIHVQQLRQAIGVVSQEPILFNTSIEENIRFGNPNATIADIYDALKNANAYNFVQRFPKGIKTIVGEKGAQLSGGQKQRIAIARVLVRNPKILLLDEATSALDNHSERVVQDALEEASKSRTTIIIAHRLSTIRHCNRIMVMSHGKIVETGNHKELLKLNGAYKNLVEAQIMETAHAHDHEKNATNTNSTVLDNSTNVSDSEIVDCEDNHHHNDMKRILEEMTEEGASKANIWQILRHCRPDWLILFFAIFGSALQGFNFPILAQIIVRVYKAYAMEGEDILIYGHFWSLMFLALGVVRPVTLYCQFYFFGKIAERLSTRLRIQSFKHLLSLPCAFYDDPKHSATRLANRLSSDASNIKAAVDARLGSVLMTLVSAIVAISAASYYSWQVTIQVLLLFPIIYLSKLCIEKTTDTAIRQDFLAIEKSNKIAVEVLENVKTVRSLNMEEKAMCMILESPLRLRAKYPRRSMLQGLASGFNVSCSQLIYSLSFKFGAYLVYHRQVVPMNMYLALVTLSYTSNMARSAISYLSDYKKAVHAAGLIFNLFTYPATMPYDDENGGQNIIEKGEIVGKEIKFSYSQRADIVLNGLNLKVEPGKSVALVGPSGCGKSTIISLLQRFYTKDSGELEIDSENVEDINLHHLHESSALVSQEPTLFNCSIKENLLYGLDRTYSDIDVENALKIANAIDFVFQFPQRLDTIVGERGAQLSGGQKQRIAIARAILRNPKILLLDEATSALDTDSEKIVQNALDTASERVSTVIVAHRLSTIVNCDSIAVLKDGKVAEQGSHDQLLGLKGYYYSLIRKSES